VSNAADKRVGVIGATCKAGEGEMINELGDGDEVITGLVGKEGESF
jgi:hypothetical protein